MLIEGESVFVKGSGGWVKRKIVKSRLRLLANDVVVQEKVRHVPHPAFAQRLCSNPSFIPHYVIELQSLGNHYGARVNSIG
jgi:hypothetical protein